MLFLLSRSQNLHVEELSFDSRQAGSSVCTQTASLYSLKTVRLAKTKVNYILSSKSFQLGELNLKQAAQGLKLSDDNTRYL